MFIWSQVRNVILIFWSFVVYVEIIHGSTNATLEFELDDLYLTMMRNN